MHMVTFRLRGEMAMWRDVRVPANDYSAALPPPSAMAGMLGIVQKMLFDPHFCGPAWNRTPFASPLVKWLVNEEVHVAVAPKTRRVVRCQVNELRMKNLKKSGEKGVDRSVRAFVLNPDYQMAVATRTEEGAERLKEALLAPWRRPYMGVFTCAGYVSEVQRASTLPEGYWAQRSVTDAGFHAVPLSLVAFQRDEKGEVMDVPARRIVKDGFWVIPPKTTSSIENLVCATRGIEHD